MYYINFKVLKNQPEFGNIDCEIYDFIKIIIIDEKNNINYALNICINIKNKLTPFTNLNYYLLNLLLSN